MKSYFMFLTTLFWVASLVSEHGGAFAAESNSDSGHDADSTNVVEKVESNPDGKIRLKSRIFQTRGRSLRKEVYGPDGALKYVEGWTHDGNGKRVSTQRVRPDG